MNSLLFFQVRETRGVNKGLRVHLYTVYFAKNNKKKIKKLLFTRGLLFICLNALFMSHEQCKRRWSIKKNKKRINTKRGCGRGIQTFT